MVKTQIMKIYTKFGDAGLTQVLGGIKLAKSDIRIDCIGEIDELNSAIGVSISHLNSTENERSPLSNALVDIQLELFQWGAMLAGAKPDRYSRPDETSVDRLESEMDRWLESLTPQTHFILPGGSLPGASLHLARTICRRAERRAMALRQAVELVPSENCQVSSEPEDINLELAGITSMQQYLNRLSDWLFVASRWVNSKLGTPEIRWEAKPR